MMQKRGRNRGDAWERVVRGMRVLLGAAGCVAIGWVPALSLAGDPAAGGGAGLAQAAGGAGSAGTPGSPAVAPVNPTPPAPSPVQFGGELRVRGESFDNPMDLDDNSNDAYQFVRMRYRFWADAKPREGLRIFLRLGNEYRWGVYGSAPGFNGSASIRDPESRVSLDNAWAEVAWPRASGLTWRFGRMDLSYGDGFLVFDGTPADGSSSGFFDGVRAKYKRNAVEADLFTMKLVDRGFGSAALDEDFHGLYLKDAGVEIYALHRYKHGATVAQQGKPWQVVQPRQRTFAIGNRLSRLPEVGWQGAFEWAVEFGDPGGAWSPAGAGQSGGLSIERSAQGAQARAGRTWAGTVRPGFELGGVYLSGDDPKTDGFEGWDDFYGEWPKYSDLLIYTMYDGTTRIRRLGDTAGSYSDDAGAWTNLVAGWVEVKGTPLSALRLTARTTLLRAAEETGPGTGKDRGLLFTTKTDYTGIPGVALQALGEWFDPGDFYSKDADSAWYARFQVTTGF